MDEKYADLKAGAADGGLYGGQQGLVLDQPLLDLDETRV
jgi:hypothetical protein